MADQALGGLEQGREALRRFLVGDDDLQAMLTTVADLATDTVPACDLASITMLRRDEPQTPVWTDEIALRLDEVQYATGDGPCLAAMRHRGPEHTSVPTDDRWPDFGRSAHERGVTAVLSVPLLDAAAGVLGALNLYSTTADAYETDAREIGARFADQLGVAAANVARYAESYTLSQQLEEALQSRAVIEQAKGVLVAQKGCTPEAAFELLRTMSQHQNRKVREIATEIVDAAQS